MQIALLLVVKINISAYILSQLQNNRRDSGCVSYFKTTCWLQFVLACVCLLTASHWNASVTRVSTKMALPQHWPSLKDQSQPCRTQQLHPGHQKVLSRFNIIYLFIHLLRVFWPFLALLIVQLKSVTGNRVREGEWHAAKGPGPGVEPGSAAEPWHMGSVCYWPS